MEEFLNNVLSQRLYCDPDVLIEYRICVNILSTFYQRLLTGIEFLAPQR